MSMSATPAWTSSPYSVDPGASVPADGSLYVMLVAARNNLDVAQNVLSQISGAGTQRIDNSPPAEGLLPVAASLLDLSTDICQRLNKLAQLLGAPV